jgi:hypothetical protein
VAGRDLHHRDFCREAKGKDKCQERGGVMEVWVRSQDKEVFENVKSVRFCRMKKCDLKAEPNTMAEFIASADAYCVECNGEFFGEYPTKERCIEIIDEIQKLLCQTFMIFRNLDITEDIAEYLKPKKGIVYQAENQTPSIEYHEQSVVVYEMPKE